MANEYTQQGLIEQIDQRVRALELPAEPGLLYDPIRYALSNGGKRIRPYLTLLGAGICGGEIEEAMPAALAIELLHNFTLLHDDIMDGAETRRGRPSVYANWNVNTAILSGDVLFVEAYAQLSYYGNSELYSKDIYRKLNHSFLEASRVVCEGQAYDMEFEEREEVNVGQYLMMIQHKTAKLLSTSLVMGGIVAGAGDDVLLTLNALGFEAGIAFQIQDDLLDAVGKPGDFGKKIGGDIAEGKMTYLTIEALNRADEKQKDEIYRILKQPASAVTDTDVETVVDLYRKLTVLEDARQAIEEYYTGAERYLNRLADSNFKDQLSDVLSSLADRQI